MAPILETLINTALTKKEATKFNRERDQLLKSLLKKNVHYGYNKSKIFTNGLSPGCKICGERKWSCMYITHLCSANCFCCPQDRTYKQEKPPRADCLLIIENPEDYADYLEKFGYKGVGFSGGECMLVFNKLLLFIETLKRKFGREVYLWAYTNGDLVDKNKLIRLKRAGLDEIRFNISARDYDLRPVALATRIMETVTVEIPVIPEDIEIVKKSLPKMQEIGVDYLNLNQLCTTQHNYKEFLRRRYTFLCLPYTPVLESEISALKLIEFALDTKMKLSINYCPSVYKYRFPVTGYLKRVASLVRKDYESITDSGLIRRISLRGSAEKIREIKKVIKKYDPSSTVLKLYHNPNEIFVPPYLTEYINAENTYIFIDYFKVIVNSNYCDEEIILSSNNKIFIQKQNVGQKQLTLREYEEFNKFILGNKLFHLFKSFRLIRNIESAKSSGTTTNKSKIFCELETLEKIGYGFPKIQ